MRWSLQTKHDSCYCWITYDDKQWSSKPESVNDSAFIYAVQYSILNYCYKNLLYHASSLTTSMRSTVQVYSYWNIASRGNKSFNWSNACFPLDKYWSYPVYLGHHICGPSVTKMHISCTCPKDMSQVIKHEIESWVKDGEVYTFHKVAVLVTPELHMLREFLGDELKEEDIPVCEAGDNCNGVVLVAGDCCHSYEWPVVIAICARNAGLNYLMFSRAVTRLVVLYIDDTFVFLFVIIAEEFWVVLTLITNMSERMVPTSRYRG